MIRVVVADDYAVVRSGLAQLLGAADDIELVNAYADARPRRSARSRPPGRRPDGSCDAAPRRRRGNAPDRAATPDAQVVVLTSFSDTDRIVAAADSGAVGYLLKDTEPDQLLERIRAAARGESPLAPKAARLLLESRRRPAAGRS